MLRGRERTVHAAVQRRRGQRADTDLAAGGLIVAAGASPIRRNRPVALTKGEYALLLAFLDAPQRPLSREYLSAGDPHPRRRLRSQHRRSGTAAAAQAGDRPERATRHHDRTRRWLRLCDSRRTKPLGGLAQHTAKSLMARASPFTLVFEADLAPSTVNRDAHCRKRASLHFRFWHL